MGWNHGSYNGYRSGCECELCTERRRVESVKNREYARKWRENNKDKTREHARKWREENRDKHRENSRAGSRLYREKNADKVRESGRIYREKNADKIRDRERVYREKNADTLRDRHLERHAIEEFLTAPSAENHRKPWTDEDKAVALDYSLTIVEASQRVGRTAKSVANLRHAAKRNTNTDNAQPTTEMDPKK